MSGDSAGARIAIVDHGMGNLRSVAKALERVGADPVVSADPQTLHDAEGLVVPGVGAFPRAIVRLRELGLDLVLGARVEAGTPLLGICLGHQLLFESSSELGGATGLGLLEGRVDELAAPGLKVPHIGWEPLAWRRESELGAGIADGTPFYFVHGFVPRPRREADVLGVAQHGERFAAVVARPPVYGVQFHPEKSGAAGLRLLANFARICARARSAATAEAIPAV